MSDIVKEREPDLLAPERRCKDFDADCAGIRDKVGCWLYDPEQGWCPYLRTAHD